MSDQESACRSTIVVDDSEETTRPRCAVTLQIDRDAEFYDGMWHDRTKLLQLE